MFPSFLLDIPITSKSCWSISHQNQLLSEDFIGTNDRALTSLSFTENLWNSRRKYL
jgi:hypothetical protein